MAAKRANAAQKQWMKDIAEWAALTGIELLYNMCPTKYELHHVAGRSYRQNKMHIGHSFIIPVPYHLHNVKSDDVQNVTHFRRNFTKQFGMQRELFEVMYNDMKELGYDVPSNEVYQAIMNTKY